MKLTGTAGAMLALCICIATPAQAVAPPRIQVLSNRADLISGHDALVQVDLATGTKITDLKVLLGATDITSKFQKNAAGKYVALVTGLKVGPNVITASALGASAQETLIDHYNGGPVIQGPQLQPWVCRNAGAIDVKCNQPAQYSWFYMPADGSGFVAFDPAHPATDVAATTTDNGVVVPYIVRVETGYMDRDQYKIAVLYRPDMPWTVQAPQNQFNHKLLITHGASCGADHQTGSAPDVMAEYALAKGFAVMSTALDNSGHNCNLVVQAESLIMLKERLIERYGTLRYTIGTGCSGGSLAEQWIANAYPGVYQGILPTCSFPDAWSTATQFLDYHLLIAYFTDPTKWRLGVVWNPEQMAAVEGAMTVVNGIVSETAQFHVAVPTDACAGVTDEQRYDPNTNPGGVRCDIQDAAVNIFGRVPKSRWSPMEVAAGHGFAGFPVDNIGVQYGLAALQQGLITNAQFLDLNQKIGGIDIDTNPSPNRIATVDNSLINAYRSGMINVGNNLDRVAIIDCRGTNPELFHDTYRAFAVRARLDKEHGTHANQLIWEGPFPLTADSACSTNSFFAMDRWLAAVEKDTSTTKTLAQKIIADKPADITDQCWSGNGTKISDGLCPGVTVPGYDNVINVGVVQVYGTPRMVAGDAITTEANKCQLKPLNKADKYGPVPFSAGQWLQMQALFPNGVCDFSKPGVHEQPTVPWQTYQTSTGGVIIGGQALPAPKANWGIGWASPAFDAFGS